MNSTFGASDDERDAFGRETALSEIQLRVLQGIYVPRFFGLLEGHTTDSSSKKSIPVKCILLEDYAVLS